MTIRKSSFFVQAAALLALAVPGVVWGASGTTALIVHDGTLGLETDVVSNLTSKLTAAGYTVTTQVLTDATAAPTGTLSSYAQIWDVRFNTTTPLNANTIAAYVAYMASSGSLFVMGENTGFLVRDNSIAALILAAGGGNITITTPANVEIVQPPFTGPNALSTVTFLAAAGTSSPGSGGFITKDASGIGAGLVWGPGNMTNAPAGSLMVVFDVNFLDLDADANSQLLTQNMIAYMAAPTVIVTPAPPALLLSLTAMLGLAGFAWLRRRARA